MLFGKYHVVIFKEKGGASRSLRLSGWFGWLLCLMFCGLAASNVWLWKYFTQSRLLEGRLAEAEYALEARQGQLAGLAEELTAVRDDLQRVQQFDTKLRVMVKTDVGVNDLPLGGAGEAGLGHIPLHRYELAARKMRAFLKELAQETRVEEVRQQELMLAMRENRGRLAVTPSIWPTEGFVTSRFGYRSSPFTGQSSFHKGLDIAAPTGTPIYAPARGTVTAAGTDGAYGLCVDISHGGGLSTKYGHMSKFVVKSGQKVERGQLIGHVGSAGRVTGPHLHYEVRVNGVPTNPYAYILN